MKAKISGLMLGLLVSTSVFAIGPPDHANNDRANENASFNSSPAQIPEPGTLALIATGLAGLAVSRRRRKR